MNTRPDEVSDESEGFSGYRGTSLIRKSAPTGPYSRSMPRVLGGGGPPRVLGGPLSLSPQPSRALSVSLPPVLGGGAISYEQGTPVDCATERHPHSYPKGTDVWDKGFRVCSLNPVTGNGSSPRRARI